MTTYEYENLKVIDLADIIIKNLEDYFSAKDAVRISNKIINEVNKVSDMTEIEK